jgi:hypothetical protein
MSKLTVLARALPLGNGRSGNGHGHALRRLGRPLLGVGGERQ